MKKGFENGRLVPSHSGGLRSHSGYIHRHSDRVDFDNVYIIASHGGALQHPANMLHYLQAKQSEKSVNALRRLIAKGKERSARLNSASQVVKLIEDK